MNLTLLVIAVLGGVALLVSRLFRRFVPEIVVFLGIGVLIGPEGPVALLDRSSLRALELLTQVALGAIIFLIGDRLRLDSLRGEARLLIPVNTLQIMLTAALVYVATRAAGAEAQAAVLLALIAAETGVLTVTATIAEERAGGRFTDLLLTSVGLTNVAVAGLFGLAFPFVLAATGEAASLLATVGVFATVVGASTILGLVGGWLLSRLAPTIETSGELLLALLIVVTGMAGAAVAVQGSVVITTLVAGLYVANRTPWLADRLFAAVRTLEAPIYLVFFIVAGASIHLDELAAAGPVTGAYVLARIVGKVTGAAAGGLAGGGRAGLRLGAGAGLGLLPHAGMAIALVAFVVEQSPRLGPEVSAIVLGSIVVFELAGPLLTRRVIRGLGEAGAAAATRTAEDLIAAAQAHGSINRILVPVGSVAAILPRLGFLLDLIEAVGAELVAVHVSRPGSGLGEDEEPRILGVVRSVAEERHLTCRTVHRVSEQIARTLVQVARDESVDLIVMGEPVRHHVLEPARWGLVSQRVMRLADVPVLVYPVDPAHITEVPSSYLRRALEASEADAAAGNVPAEEHPVSADPGPVPDVEGGGLRPASRALGDVHPPPPEP